MPISGRKQGPPGVSRNRHPPVHEWIEVEDTPHTGGPDLPPARRDGRLWPEWAVQRWQDWRSMPHAVLWTAGDWGYAVDALEVAVLGFDKGSAMMIGEARQGERLLGTTMDSRRDLRIRYTESGGLGGEFVALADYRRPRRAQ
jgi:hypothetical protein